MLVNLPRNELCSVVNICFYFHYCGTVTDAVLVMDFKEKLQLYLLPYLTISYFIFF